MRLPNYSATDAFRIFKPILALSLFFTCGCLTAQSTGETSTAEEPETIHLTESLLPRDFRETIQEAKEKVFPAVVFIHCISKSFLEGKASKQVVSGSGVIISENGEVLTNWHVVDNATEVRCLLSDGRSAPARVIGTDKDMDIALLQIEGADGAVSWPHAQLGDSSRLSEGDFVMAMGAPWGLSRSVSIGIISCKDRYLPGVSEYHLWMQTDAAISPGNSGGPLVDTEGWVVGINTLGIPDGGDTGFAIPSSTIRQILPILRERGHLDWSYSGIELQALTDFNRNIYFDADTGVMVASTDNHSPAKSSGIQAGDRILSIGGSPVKAISEEQLPEIRRMIGLLPSEESITLEIDRHGTPVSKTVVLHKKGSVKGEELDCPRWDFTAKSINRFDTPDLYFRQPEGVFVLGVKYPGNAGRSGLVPRDILIQIDNVPIKTLDDIRTVHAQAMEKNPGERRSVVIVLRSGQRRQIVLDYSMDHNAPQS